MPLKPDLGMRIYDNNLANQSNFFKGTDNLQTLEFDPLITGYAFIVWTKLPTWVEQEYPGFKNMTQKNFKAFSGLSDLELQTAAHTQGFAGNEYHVATNMQKQNTEFTLRHAEFSGSPIRNMYQLWVTGIRDPETGIATYPKKYGMDYAAKNHTGEIMYIMTRPDANNADFKNIEFAAYYTNVFPKRVPLGHLNFEQGSHEAQTIEIPFAGTLHLSPQVDAYAQELLKTTYAFRSEDQFDPRDNAVGGSTLNSFQGNNEGSSGSGLGDVEAG
jgi:hypothetical protein